jgi:hypothetical protein
MSERNGTVSPADPGTRPIVMGEGTVPASDADGTAAAPVSAAEPAPVPGRAAAR